MRRLILTVVAAVSCAVVGPAGLLARDATPAADVGEAIDPAECRVAPRSAEAVFALWSREDGANTASATGDWYADPVLTAAAAPLGQPAEPEIVAAISATVREMYACANADDLGRFLAFVSDGMLGRLGREISPAGGVALERVRSILAAPAAARPAQDRYRLVAVTDVSVMDDGRVAAFVVEDDPTEPPEGPQTELNLFVEERGRWVVDGVLEFTDEEALPAPDGPASPSAGATPAAGLPGVRGRSYRSPTYGYALAWDATWTVENSTTADGQDELRLSRGLVLANFHGLPAGAGTTLPADPAGCLEAIIQRLPTDARITTFGPAPPSVGTPIRGGPNAAAAVWVGDVTSSGGATAAVAFFVSCRSLGPDAVLFTTYAVWPEWADEAVPLLHALDASIVLPGDATPPAGTPAA